MASDPVSAKVFEYIDYAKKKNPEASEAAKDQFEFFTKNLLPKYAYVCGIPTQDDKASGTKKGVVEVKDVYDSCPLTTTPNKGLELKVTLGEELGSAAYSATFEPATFDPRTPFPPGTTENDPKVFVREDNGSKTPLTPNEVRTGYLSLLFNGFF